jgi:penicillin-binding protein 1A
MNRLGWRKLLKAVLYTFGVFSILVFVGIGGLVYYYGRDLPNRLDLASTYKPSVVSTVYDIRGQPIGEFYLQRRVVVPLERIPRYVIQAIVAAEDARFFKHKGLDGFAIFRAFISNLRKGGVRQGGSTLTQQLVRGFFLTPERTLKRKIREAILALRVERNHTKEEILYLYLNQVYLGHGNYGVEAASRDYFGKGVAKITMAQAALLAGLPRSPSRSSPYSDYFHAIERQRYVLHRMYKEGFITKAAYQEALQEPIRLTPALDLNSQIAPHFVEYIRRTMGERYGFDPLLQGGLHIYTTLDASIQLAAQKAVREGLDELRFRFKKKWGSADPERGEVEGALVALDPHTGMVRALVGGYDFTQSQFNRALQAKRQPGSAFKPIVYSAALESGFSQLSVVQDGPLSFRLASGKVWRPHNYDNRFHGPVTLRTALAHSLNSVAVRLAERVGVEKVIKQARKLGIESPMEKNLSISLGASSLSVLELVGAYGVFANGGRLVEPLFIIKVTDRQGKILEQDVPSSAQVISSQVAYIMTDMLRNVVQSGTGRPAAKLGRNIAGKTGTTSEFRDGWFVGYNPDLIAGVWVGYDDYRPLGEKESGARTALPIWISFMMEAGKESKSKDFPVPDGIGWMEIKANEDGSTLTLSQTASPGKIPVLIGAGGVPRIAKKAKPPDSNHDAATPDASNETANDSTTEPEL